MSQTKHAERRPRFYAPQTLFTESKMPSPLCYITLLLSLHSIPFFMTESRAIHRA